MRLQVERWVGRCDTLSSMCGYDCSYSLVFVKAVTLDWLQFRMASNETYTSNVYALQVVGRVSESQLQVGEICKKKILLIDVFNHQDLRIYGFTLNTYQSFYALEVVDRVSETQLLVGEISIR